MKIGLRTLKTVLAVWVCFLIGDIRQAGVPFYAAIAAILCVQHNMKDSFRVAKNREIATIIGGICVTVTHRFRICGNKDRSSVNL